MATDTGHIGSTDAELRPRVIRYMEAFKRWGTTDLYAMHEKIRMEAPNDEREHRTRRRCIDAVTAGLNTEACIAHIRAGWEY